MRILLANYRYFVSGGPERYMFNVADALTDRGHHVVPFSIRYARNRPSPYAGYFAEPLGGETEVTFREHRQTPRTIVRTATRLFYAPDVERAASRLIADTRPDVAYVLHYLRKLSPSLLVALKRAGLPIVVRLSDYAMLCPQAHFVRAGAPCELCSGGNLLPSVRHGCVQGSVAISAMQAAATWFHRMRGYFDLIDAFVLPSHFLLDRMLSAGFDAARLRLVPTFVDSRTFSPPPSFSKDDYVVYAGRLDPLKGVDVLLRGFSRHVEERPTADVRLKIAGAGDVEYEGSLRALARGLGIAERVDFLGFLDGPALVDLVGRARVAVVPSVWYENMPNSLLEAYASGTGVLASDLGSLPECVEPGRSGYLFRPGDPFSLANALARVLDEPGKDVALGRCGRALAETTYAPDAHIDALERLFLEVRLSCRSPGQTVDPSWTRKQGR